MNELIQVINGEVSVDSRMIAEHFGKAHSDVLKDIRDEVVLATKPHQRTREEASPPSHQTP